MKRFFRWLIYLSCFFMLIFGLFRLFEGIFSLNEANNVDKEIKAEEKQREDARLLKEKIKKEEEEKLNEIERIKKEDWESELVKQIGEPAFDTMNINNEQLAQQRFYIEFTQQDLIQVLKKIKIVQSNNQKIIDYYSQNNRKNSVEKDIPFVTQKMQVYLDDVESQVYNQKRLSNNQRKYLNKTVQEIRHTIYYARQTLSMFEGKQLLSEDDLNNINYFHKQGMNSIEEALFRIDVFEKHMSIPSPALFLDNYLYKKEGVELSENHIKN